MRREEEIVDQTSLSISDLIIDYLNLDNSVRNNERTSFLNQGAVTVEVHSEMKNYSSNREIIRSIRNHPSINATLIISVLNVMVGNQIRASDVDKRIISLKIPQKLDTSDKKVHRNMENPKTRAYRLTEIDNTSENSKDQSEQQKIYASMAHMSSNA